MPQESLTVKRWSKKKEDMIDMYKKKRKRDKKKQKRSEKKKKNVTFENRSNDGAEEVLVIRHRQKNSTRQREREREREREKKQEEREFDNSMTNTIHRRTNQTANGRKSMDTRFNKMYAADCDRKRGRIVVKDFSCKGQG